MIKIRTGIYTIYQDIHCQIFEERIEVPTSKSDLKFSICYPSEDGKPLIGFQKHAFANLFCKSIHLNEIDNAYSVKTFGNYRGIIVQVFEKKLENPEIVGIGTYNIDEAIKLNLRKISNDWFIKDITLNELAEIWEERSPAFGLPMPGKLKDKEFIRPNSDFML